MTDSMPITAPGITDKLMDTWIRVNQARWSGDAEWALSVYVPLSQEAIKVGRSLLWDLYESPVDEWRLMCSDVRKAIRRNGHGHDWAQILKVQVSESVMTLYCAPEFQLEVECGTNLSNFVHSKRSPYKLCTKSMRLIGIESLRHPVEVTHCD